MRWLPRFVFLLIVVFEVILPLAAAQVSAQGEPADRKYSLADLVGLAIQHTKLLGVQDARIEEARLSAAQARVWPGLSPNCQPDARAG